MDREAPMTMHDPRLSEDADRTHHVYWGSHGCCLPYRHVGPCVCDCALVHVERVYGHGMNPHDGLPMLAIDTEDVGWTPTAGDWRVFGEDVYGPSAPA